MPTFEVKCGTCPSRPKFETLLRRYDDPNPNCPSCGSQTERLLAAPATIWAGDIGKYSDPTKEGYNPDGVVAYRVNSSRNVDGSPEKVFLRTRQQQKEFCRAEGLRMPDEVNSNAEMKKNGRGLDTNGIKGQWTGMPVDVLVDDGKAHVEGWI